MNDLWEWLTDKREGQDLGVEAQAAHRLSALTVLLAGQGQGLSARHQTLKM